MKVLLSSASRKVLLLEAFQAAVGPEGLVVAADTSSLAPAIHFADCSVKVPPSQSDLFCETMIKLCTDNGIGLVIPTRDAELPVWAAVRREFEDIGVRVHVSSPKTIELCLDKMKFHRFCLDNNHPVPVPITHPTEADLPLFRRPRRGSGGSQSSQISSVADLESIDTDSNILTPYIEADEYSVDLFIGREPQHRSAVPRRRVSVIGGESYVGQTVDDQDLANACLRLCVDLGIEGHATVQAFRTPNAVMFIEVNPRFGGGSALSIAAGANSPRWLVQEARGDSLDPAPGPFRSDLMMLRYTRDLYIDAADLDGAFS